ncbi:hemerythrin domain-containing protein [Ramlibacter solisilvae]|uniref:Hemerythrin n=1 Tax=Ramlibacter tataouinensis TaxID=94132 RepID=A0A127JXW4_9BURK|nr:hemerythrin domain-containing protein [Ramlibacter tataouinensis]AMO24761.1 hemerythrin [Ramlibacter tataouinensis]
MGTPAALQVIHDEHVAVAAVLRSMLPLVEQGPGGEPGRFFDLLRAMLFYIDEFPEQRHHPKESNLLFPKLARLAPELMPVIRQLEIDHVQGEGRVRALQHQLLAWELVGESRRAGFAKDLQAYVRFYLEHMRMEETEVLPVAERVLKPSDWAELDRTFENERDPLAGGVADPAYEQLFTRIVMATPAPLGVGRELHKTPA